MSSIVIQSRAKDLVDIHVFIHFVFSRSFLTPFVWMTNGKERKNSVELRVLCGELKT